MVQMNLHVAKAQLSQIARRVKAGETIILCDRNRPFAEIRPLTGTSKPKLRKLGQLKGMAPVGSEFFEADEAIAATFNDSPLLTSPDKK